MACLRSQDLDLLAFLAAPRAGEFADFRQHYPRCADCAAELRAWTELHEALAAEHPDPEQLARYDALPADARGLLDRHLASCPSCREELAQLADFDPARLAQPAAPVEAPARRWLAGLGRVLWSPAFAYALLLLMALPTLMRVSSQDARAPLAEQIFAPEAAVVAEQQLIAELESPDAERDAMESPRQMGAKLDAMERPAALGRGELAYNSVAKRALPREPADTRAKQAAKSLEAKDELADADDGLLTAASVLPPNLLRLEAYRSGRAQLPAAGEVLRVSVPVPAPMAAGEGWLVLRDAEGRRELRERVELSAAGPTERRVELRIPREWLAPGAYTLQLEGAGAAPAKFAFELD